VAVLTAVCVSITHDVMIIMIDDKMDINLVVLVDSVVDAVLICAESRQIIFITVFNDVLVYVFEILTNKEPNSSVANSD
jgi:hypothetical protein